MICSHSGFSCCHLNDLFVPCDRFWCFNIDWFNLNSLITNTSRHYTLGSDVIEVFHHMYSVLWFQLTFRLTVRFSSHPWKASKRSITLESETPVHAEFSLFFLNEFHFPIILPSGLLLLLNGTAPYPRPCSCFIQPKEVFLLFCHYCGYRWFRNRFPSISSFHDDFFDTFIFFLSSNWINFLYIHTFS